jgi:N-acetylated-alpha-linked acidic dipeptidase
MNKILRGLVCALTLLVLGSTFTWGRPNAMLRGFFAAGAAREAEIEKAFRSMPTAERAQRDLWILTQTPHVAGTPEDLKTAQYVLEQFREAGLDARVIEYRVLLPMPKEVKVDLLEPFKRQGPTPEGGGSSNPESYDPSTGLAFNAYSPSGDITAPVVYANYGLPEDYQHLKEIGVNVAGKIVMVRYGKCFRGVKAYVAEQHHAGGLLIYSDPAEDGYSRGEIYPAGPWRPATSVQRGTILYMTNYPGDPLKGAKRLGMKEPKSLPHILTAPISAEDAAPILENLGGPLAPRAWQGSLPFTFHVGPGASKVHLKLQMDFQTRPIWNVMAEIPGTTEPSSWVLVGNHRDAWTYGAVDPNSGTAPLLAVARGLGQLLKQGWRPQRTIILGSWDAEEFGLIGSTEWAEDHANHLTRDAVAYLNMDIGVSGQHFGASAVPSLSRLIREVTQDVTDPKSGRPLYAVWSEESKRVRRESGTDAADSDDGTSPEGSTEPNVSVLGSGSDYTPFLQHLGVPSLNVGFDGPYGVYHAAVDNYDWMQKFGDPTFAYSTAAAQVFGTLALRLADADILPFEYGDYGRGIQQYLGDLTAQMRKSHLAGKLQLEHVTTAAVEFFEIANALDQKIAGAGASAVSDPGELAALNHLLLEVERDFLLDRGLPGRPWFRHAFYAPGVYTGYSAVIMPGVREAVDNKDWRLAAEQLNLLQSAIERGTATLTQALQILGDGFAADLKTVDQPAGH